MKNNGEYFRNICLSFSKVVATTSEGKYIRVADKCEPVRNFTTYCCRERCFNGNWLKKCYNRRNTKSNISKFIENIKASDRIKQSVREKSDFEILEHYHLMEKDLPI